MQNQSRISKLIVLNVIVLMLTVGILNITHAQENPELHRKTLEYLSRWHISSNQVAQISVGNQGGFSAIAVDISAHRVYATNAQDNTVSVIDGTTNKNIKNIAVGKTPTAIGVNSATHKVYVVNNNDSVSVINGATNEFIRNIAVGKTPMAIGVDNSANTIYVVNSNNSVSVIDGTTNKNIKNIPVGVWPKAIDVNSDYHIVYVANSNNSVSVIDGTTNKNIKNIAVGKTPISGEPTAIGHRTETRGPGRHTF